MEKKTGGENGKKTVKKRKRMMRKVATMSLPAVDRWNAARTCQFLEACFRCEEWPQDLKTREAIFLHKNMRNNLPYPLSVWPFRIKKQYRRAKMPFLYLFYMYLCLSVWTSLCSKSCVLLRPPCFCSSVLFSWCLSVLVSLFSSVPVSWCFIRQY